LFHPSLLLFSEEARGEWKKTGWFEEAAFFIQNYFEQYNDNDNVILGKGQKKMINKQTFFRKKQNIIKPQTVKLIMFEAL
jgi:hypothetical protein